MLSHPLSYPELATLAAGALGTLVLAGLAAGALAHRKGYDAGLWAFAGATVIGLVALAFLPSADDSESPDGRQWRRLAGNRAGGCFAALWLVALVASFATNPDEDDLKRFARNELPRAHDEGVAGVMAGAQGSDCQVTRQNCGLYSTGTVRVSGHGSVKTIGFWGAWRAAG